MIGQRIKQHRQLKNMTQEALALKLSVTRQAISNWECGKTEPDIKTIHALAAALEIPVDRLIKEPIFVSSSPPELTESEKETFLDLVQSSRARFAENPRLRQIIAVHTVHGNTYFQEAPWEEWTPGDFRCEAALGMRLEEAKDTQVRFLAVMWHSGTTPAQPEPMSWFLAQELLQTDFRNLNTLVLLWAGSGDNYRVKPLHIIAPPSIVKRFSQENS